MGRDPTTHSHRAVRLDPDVGALEPADAEADELVHSARPDPGHLHVAAIADAAESSIVRCRSAVVDELAGAPQRLWVVAVVEFDHGPNPIRQLLWTDHVLKPQLHRITPQLRGHQVNCPLANACGLGLPESPVCPRGHGVGGNHPAHAAHGIPAVRAGHDAEHGEQRSTAEDRESTPGVATTIDPQAPQRSVIVERHFYVVDFVAGVGGGQ